MYLTCMHSDLERLRERFIIIVLERTNSGPAWFLGEFGQDILARGQVGLVPGSGFGQVKNIFWLGSILSPKVRSILSEIADLGKKI